MNFTLTITGSPAALAAAMEAFEAVERDDSGRSKVVTTTPEQAAEMEKHDWKLVQTGRTGTAIKGELEGNETQTASTNTGTGTPQPMPQHSEPSGDAATHTAPSPTTTPNVTDLDADGLPWDGRIHAKTKTKKSDGTWTMLRGGPKGEELIAIQAELRAVVAGSAPTPTPMPSTPEPAPTPTPMPMPQDAADNAPTVETITFGEFMQNLTPRMMSQVITTDYLIGVVKETNGALGLSLNTVTDVQSNPDAQAHVIGIFQRDGVW